MAKRILTGKQTRLHCYLLPLCFIMLLSGCMFIPTRSTRRDPSTITVTEAEKLLRLAEQAAQAHDEASLCNLGWTIERCKRMLIDRGGWKSVPPTSPKIVDTYVIPRRQLSHNTGTEGGRVLVLEGVDGLGRAYRTEFFVIPLGSNDPDPLGTGIGAAHPVYWSGMRIGSGPDADGTYRHRIEITPAP
jgi:hypothetical protein